MTSAESFFTSEDGIWFTPTGHCRGPWNENHCHAGPPTGLLARAVQRLLPAQRLTRLSVNLIRPVPQAGFRVEASLEHEGRTVSHSRASIRDGAGKVCAMASALHMTPQTECDYATYSCDIGSPEDASAGPFPVQRSLHDKPFFNTAVETRYVAGHDHRPGPTTAWLKTPPLLPDEQPTPFERICPLADCGNALSRNAEVDEVNFMNPDLSIVLHRDPKGEWLGSQSQGYWQSNGIGMADALLFDREGAVGRAIQTLLLRPALNQV